MNLSPTRDIIQEALTLPKIFKRLQEQTRQKNPLETQKQRKPERTGFKTEQKRKREGKKHG